MRRKVSQPILIIAFMVGVLSTRPLPGQQAIEPVKRGESLLSENCARCHAIGRTGESPRGDAPLFRTLSRKYEIEGLGEALAEGLSVGHPDMPEFVFEPDDVGAILDYLKSIQQP